MKGVTKLVSARRRPLTKQPWAQAMITPSAISAAHCAPVGAWQTGRTFSVAKITPIPFENARIASGPLLRVSRLIRRTSAPRASAAPSARSAPGAKTPVPGRMSSSPPGQGDGGGGPSDGADPFAEEQHGQHHGDDRVEEADRHRFGEGDRGDRGEHQRDAAPSEKTP